MNIVELSKFIGASPSWIEKQLPKGLPSAKVGGRRFFKASAVVEWIDKEGR